MRPRDAQLAERIDRGLRDFEGAYRQLPGIRDPGYRVCFIEQLLESFHRVRFIQVVSARHISERRGDPSDELFDPLKAAILRVRMGNVEEAFWLVFLFVHFGKNPRGGWRYAREIYGRLGDGLRWDWVSISRDPDGFCEWLNAQQAELKRPGVPGGFGNHRKYESLDAFSPGGTGVVVKSYVEWLGPSRSHERFIADVLDRNEGDPHRTFDQLYHSMSAVKRFGRLARFDYLAMVGKLGLAPISPGSAYLGGSTGPLRGAKLLFGGEEPAATLDEWLVELDRRLGVGMQVLEDALCNWEKSPGRFVPFRA